MMTQLTGRRKELRLMTVKEFSDGWKHFCDCIDFARSGLDAEAIRFMNEMPAAVSKGLIKDKEVTNERVSEVSRNDSGG